MRRQIRKICNIIMIMLCSSIVIMCSPVSKTEVSSNTEKVVLQLKWTHQFQFAGYYSALEQGYFREEGLDVKILAGGPGINVDDEVISGRANYGILASELIKKWQDGKPVVLVAPIIQHSIRSLMVRKNSMIFSPHDLIGKRVVVVINEDPEIKTMFLNEGIIPSQINFESQDKESEKLFLNGKIDSVVGSMANQPFQFKLKGVEVRTIRPINYGVDFYGDCLFTSEHEAKTNPARVDALTRAVKRGWEYAFKHRKETIVLIQKKYAPEKTTGQLDFEAQTLYSLMLPDLVEIGHNNPDRWMRIAETYSNAGIMKPVVSLEGFLYNPLSVIDYKWFRWLGMSFGVVLIILAGIMFWNSQLRQMVKQRTGTLEKQFKELKQKESALMQSESLLNRSQIQAGLGSFVWIIHDDSLSWSRNMFVIHGMDQDSFSGNLMSSSNQSIHPADRARVKTEISKMIDNRKISTMEFRIIRPDGIERIIQLNGDFEYDQHGEVMKCIGIHQDITERKIAEEQVMYSLKEKEALLREIYHRTKNNMGIICALLDLQSSFTDNETVIQVLTETKNRILTMALVHEKLYQTHDLSSLNLKEYVVELVELLMKSSHIPANQISPVFHVNDVFVLIDTAIPCGLILNELISNAISYAFPDNRQGEIRISISRTENGDIELNVSDNGVGTREGFDFRKEGRLGLQNIYMIGEVQLQGKVEFDSNKGVSCSIKFKDDQYLPRI